jgi:hypothetical protein
MRGLGLSGSILQMLLDGGGLIEVVNIQSPTFGAARDAHHNCQPGVREAAMINRILLRHSVDSQPATGNVAGVCKSLPT